MTHLNFFQFFLYSFTVCSSCFAQSITVPTESSVVYDICFSPHGHALFVADDRNVKIFETRNIKELGELRGGHSGSILALELSGDSTRLVSGGKDSVIVVWDLPSKAAIKKLPKATGFVTSVSISTKQNLLAYGTSDHRVFVYDLLNDNMIAELERHDDHITAVEFAADGKLLATAGGKTINLYDSTWKQIASLTGHRDIIRGLAFDPHQKKLTSCGDDGKIVFWDMKNPRQPRSIGDWKIGYSWILCIDYGSRENVYAVGTFSGKIKINAAGFGYHSSIDAPIQRIKVMPSTGQFITVCIATHGKGVRLLHAKDMNVSNR
jgi:WD40 repeat protein